MKYANRQDKTEQEFPYDESVIQVKGYLLATALLLKYDIIILSDFIGLCKGAAPIQTEVKVDLSTHLIDCANLIKLAHNIIHPIEEVQGHVFSAQLCGFSRSLGSSTTSQASTREAATDKSQTSDSLRETALNHLTQARALLEKYPSIAMLKDEIDAVENMLNDYVYPQVMAEELRIVYKAMAGELRGTGHCYTCQNGHPFTIDQCGMPMEEARCPECGAPICEHNHVAVEGVRHAVEIEGNCDAEFTFSSSSTLNLFMRHRIL